MKIYKLEVSIDDFDYDETDECVIVSESKEKAIFEAKKIRDVNWVVESAYNLEDIKNTTVISAYVYRG